MIYPVFSINSLNSALVTGVRLIQNPSNSTECTGRSSGRERALIGQLFIKLSHLTPIAKVAPGIPNHSLRCALVKLNQNDFGLCMQQRATFSESDPRTNINIQIKLYLPLMLILKTLSRQNAICDSSIKATKGTTLAMVESSPTELSKRIHYSIHNAAKKSIRCCQPQIKHLKFEVQ